VPLDCRRGWLAVGAAPCGRLESPSTCPRRFGLRRHFRSSLGPIWWRLIGRTVCRHSSPLWVRTKIDVATLSSDSRLHYQDAIRSFPALVARLARATATSNVRGAVTASRRLDRVATRNSLSSATLPAPSIRSQAWGSPCHFQQAVALAEAMARRISPSTRPSTTVWQAASRDGIRDARDGSTR